MSSLKMKKILIFLTIFTLSFWCLVEYQNLNNLSVHQKPTPVYKVISEKQIDAKYLKSNQEKRNTLFWTRFLNNTSWYTGGGEEVGADLLEKAQCPDKNCFFTHNHNLLANETQFDAIIFDIHDEFNLEMIPKARSENQIYFMITNE